MPCRCLPRAVVSLASLDLDGVLLFPWVADETRIFVLCRPIMCRRTYVCLFAGGTHVTHAQPHLDDDLFLNCILSRSESYCLFNFLSVAILAMRNHFHESIVECLAPPPYRRKVSSLQWRARTQTAHPPYTRVMYTRVNLHRNSSYSRQVFVLTVI